MACDDEVLPLQERIETVGDEADLQDVYNTERKLLYGAHSAMIDADLYLPEDWIKDLARCKKSGIPEESRTFKTKAFEKRQHRRQRQARIAQNQKRKKLGLPKVRKMQVSFLPK
jgi:hypothetical protein